MKRYFSVDLLRGVAVFGMIVFHFLYVLDFSGMVTLHLRGDLMMFFVRCVQFLFLGLVGFSLGLSRERMSQGFSGKRFARLAKIGAAALVVSVATYLAFGDIYVRFGVLHFIFLASIFVFPFARRRVWLIGIVLAGLVGWVVTREVDFNLPMIAYVLGFKSVSVPTFDYFPIFPWIIVVAVGALIQNFSEKFMPSVEEKVAGVADRSVGRGLLFLGRNSLLVYLSHVPLIILILLLYSLGKDVLM